MAVTLSNAGQKTTLPSWKVIVMTGLTVLTPIALRLANRSLGYELFGPGDITGITGFIVAVGGWFAPPQGIA